MRGDGHAHARALFFLYVLRALLILYLVFLCLLPLPGALVLCPSLPHRPRSLCGAVTACASISIARFAPCAAFARVSQRRLSRRATRSAVAPPDAVSGAHCGAAARGLVGRLSSLAFPPLPPPNSPRSSSTHISPPCPSHSVRVPPPPPSPLLTVYPNGAGRPAPPAPPHPPPRPLYRRAADHCARRGRGARPLPPPPHRLAQLGGGRVPQAGRLFILPLCRHLGRHRRGRLGGGGGVVCDGRPVPAAAAGRRPGRGGRPP